ncbi:histidine kinase [Amphritea sp. 2_MG-2023]|uniref:histidine kinase n=1 Tax=Amphritea TaxID=515417 RepID=UPI001C0745B1|nr:MULTISPECIES: histidine kinase [Amphritea]MBU2967128.1 CHASE domain-containing protein [Amphritea atlantica]MDO6419319.1 histidine kinase [Amphritea sp. 2_MG-2023]MDX2421232.1 histidine kinase [Amphritea sp.]
MQRSYFPLTTTIWFFLTILMLSISLVSDYDRLKKKLSNDAHFVYSSIYEKTYINEVLLQNFTVLVSADPENDAVIRRFANEMRKRYPHIERLQIQHQLPPLSISYGAATDYKIDPTNTDFNARFPVTFIEPLNSDTRYLLNKDLLADPLFAETIRFARQYHQPVTSPPFPLDHNKSGYGLFLAFFERNAEQTPEHLYIASLIINTQGMLPTTSFLSEHASISLMNDQGDIIEQYITPDKKHFSWLPALEEQRTINRFGQSFKLSLMHQIGPKDINLGMLLILLSTSVAFYFMLTAYLRQKVQSAIEHSSVYETLEHERQQLEVRIHQRTRELHEQLTENRRLTHQIIAVQERERRNLARELHDELGQSLTAIRTDAKILKRTHPEESSLVNQTADSIDAIAQNIYDVTYGMMRSLRPSALDDLGLVDAIQECIASNRFKEHGITLHTDFSGALNEMSEVYNITLFRLAQESFSNIIKYADQARNVWLDIRRTSAGHRKDISGDRLELMISDDGCGFDIKAKAFKKGFGLIGMRERVRALGGYFQISKNHDQGTRIIAIIPLMMAAQADSPTPATPDQAEPVEPPL